MPILNKSLEANLLHFKVQDVETLFHIAQELLDQVNFTYQPVRLIGLTVSNLDNQAGETVQLKIDYK